jgi:hypothetical protein
MQGNDMSNKSKRKNTQEEPMIKIAGEWVPAHKAWAQMEFASEVTDMIERFNADHPTLSTETTREVVPIVRQRLKDIALRMPRKGQDAPDLVGIITESLARMSPEEVVDQLREQHGQDISVRDLITLAGESLYEEALAREASEYRANRILPEQTAQIWNDMARPVPGGGLWSGKKVEQIMRAHDPV